jgi:hypothetical protein
MLSNNKKPDPLLLWPKKGLFLIFSLCLVTGAMAIPASNPGNQMPNACSRDTLPAKKQGRQGGKEDNYRKSLDKSLKYIEKTRERLEERFSKMDWDRLDREIEKSIKEADLEKILNQTNKAVQQALENIDFKKMEERIEQSLRKAREKLDNPVFQKSPESLVNPAIDKIA